jgi:hypothetical protein
MFDDIDKKSVIYLLGVYGLGVMAMALTNAQVSGDIITNEFVWIGAAIISKVSTMKDKAYLYVEESH